ncbi:MAG: riboflavin synthase subunit alpha [Patescibacteria group bacterium]
MYSGIVQSAQKIKRIEEKDNLRVLSFEFSVELLVGLKKGASVSVGGVCLTVAKIDGSTAYFEVMNETLDKTTLGSLKEGDEVNIERSLKFGDEVGGHILSGHVRGIAEILEIERLKDYKIIFQVPEEWMKYILPKGFIAIDGCSLTVVDANQRGEFSVCFIPETLNNTTFGVKKIGDRVNVEIDAQTQAIVETAERVLGVSDGVS